jgi:hypothetical protein
VQPEPAKPKKDDDLPPRPAPPTGPLEPDVWLGVGLAGALGIGLGPPSDLQGVVGGGAAGSFVVTHQSGATASAQVRGLVDISDELVLSRVRVALSGGYAYTRGTFELVAEAGVTVEPLWLRGAEGLETTGDDAHSLAPLVGGRLAVGPGFFVWSRPRRARIRLGIDVELAGSVEAVRSAGAIRILRRRGDATTPAFRAGGLELSATLGVQARFVVPPR